MSFETTAELEMVRDMKVCRCIELTSRCALMVHLPNQGEAQFRRERFLGVHAARRGVGRV